MQESSFFIRRADPDKMQDIWAIIEGLGYRKDHDYIAQCLERQSAGELSFLIGGTGQGHDVGYCVLNWKPKYAYFKHLGCPEIQDLNILQEFRRKGYARAMIAHCEALAQERGCAEMGIGVGLTASYGPAQRLYIREGYLPDGQGVSYDRKQIGFGELRPVDDQLCLMMTKKLI